MTQETTVRECVVRLPFPLTALSPNARVDRHFKANAVKTYRHECKILALKTKREQGVAFDGPVVMRVVFILKSLKRRRDWDNLLASFKAGIDGISDALLPDDSIQVIRELSLAVEEGAPGVAVYIEAVS